MTGVENLRRQNPFSHMGKWYWFDETGSMSKPYPTQMDALRDLLAYCDYLNGGSDLWTRIKRAWRALIG